jgi:hypothetical protein
MLTQILVFAYMLGIDFILMILKVVADFFSSAQETVILYVSELYW